MKSFQPRVFITFFPLKKLGQNWATLQRTFHQRSVIGIVATYLLHQLQSIGADKQLRAELY